MPYTNQIKKLLLKGRISEAQLLTIKKILKRRCRPNLPHFGGFNRRITVCMCVCEKKKKIARERERVREKKCLRLNRFQHNLVQEEHNEI